MPPQYDPSHDFTVGLLLFVQNCYGAGCLTRRKMQLDQSFLAISSHEVTYLNIQTIPFHGFIMPNEALMRVQILA